MHILRVAAAAVLMALMIAFPAFSQTAAATPESVAALCANDATATNTCTGAIDGLLSGLEGTARDQMIAKLAVQLTSYYVPGVQNHGSLSRAIAYLGGLATSPEQVALLDQLYSAVWEGTDFATASTGLQRQASPN